MKKAESKGSSKPRRQKDANTVDEYFANIEDPARRHVNQNA